MVRLRSGRKVHFLGKNIPKRAYTYKTPIPKEEESELITKIGSISIHEPVEMSKLINVPSETTVQDNNANNGTYDSDNSIAESIATSTAESIAESTVHNDDQSTLETSDQSQIEIDTSEMPDKFVGIVGRFEAKMAKGDKHFKLMGLLNASSKLMNSCYPALLDSSNSSQDSVSSESSQDMTEDSILTSTNASSTYEENENQNIFSDISSVSSLSSTLKTMIDKAIESDSSSDEDDGNDIEQSNAADERRPNFSENSYQEIYEMYNVIQM